MINWEDKKNDPNIVWGFMLLLFLGLLFDTLGAHTDFENHIKDHPKEFVEHEHEHEHSLESIEVYLNLIENRLEKHERMIHYGR